MLIPSKFKLDEEMSLVGNPMRVAGILQLEDPEAKLATRYLLTGETGATQILQECGEAFALLRPFPPGAQPQAAGSLVTVMGEKYTLGGVSKLKVLGAEGAPPGGKPASPVVLSGRFQGPMGELVREIVPGAKAQTFYSVKPVSGADLMTAEQIAAVQAAAVQMREQQAQAEAETQADDRGGWVKKLGGWAVTVLVILGLAFACSDSDDSSSGSARSVSVRSGGGFHGK